MGLIDKNHPQKLSKDLEKATTPQAKQAITEKMFDYTGLTGKLLKKSSLEFSQSTGEAMVSLQFNSEGSDLFAKITKELLVINSATPLDYP